MTGTATVVEENGRWGASPLTVYQYGQLNYEHQDWIGTERLLTDGGGNPTGEYASLPFGDGYMSQGADIDPYHYAGLDHDSESGLDHAQFREYQNAGGQWMSPDPYSGSYDWSDPQSFNRYAYVLNNPLSFTDPTGLSCTDNVGTYETGSDGGTVIAGNCFPGGGGGDIGILADIAEFFAGLFGGGPSFHGSLHPRPEAPNRSTAACIPQAAFNTIPNGGGAIFNAAYYGSRLAARVTGLTVGFGFGGGAGFGVGGFGIAFNGSAMLTSTPEGNSALVASATLPSAGLLQMNLPEIETGAAANFGVGVFAGSRSALQGGIGMEFDGAYGPFAASASTSGVSITGGVGAGARFGATVSPAATASIPICD